MALLEEGSAATAQGPRRLPSTHPRGHWNGQTHGLAGAGPGQTAGAPNWAPCLFSSGAGSPGPGPLSSSVSPRRKPRPGPPPCSAALRRVPRGAAVFREQPLPHSRHSVSTQEFHSENYTPQVRMEHTRHQHPDPKMGHGISEALPVPPEATLHPQGDLSSD